MPFAEFVADAVQVTQKSVLTEIDKYTSKNIPPSTPAP